MKRKLLKTTLFIIILFIVVNNLIFFPDNILSWDVFGYYLYLPFKFIYHDLGLRNFSVIPAIIEKYHNTYTFYQASLMPDGGYVMKYSMGLAVFYAPFFFAGHVAAGMLNYPQDGFSIPYQYAIWAGSLLFSVAGIVALTKVLLHFFSEKITALTAIIIVFATNYIVHITMYGQFSYSHNYLFTCYAFILWLTIKWHQSYKTIYALILAFLCGMCVLSRPSEMVCVFIPFFWGMHDKKSLISKIKILKQHWLQVIIFGLIVVAIGSLQLYYWKSHTGKFLFNSYGGNAGEGLDFTSPYTLKVLFSFRKGWLIYTPVMVFALAGFIILYHRNRPVFTPLFIYLVINLYIVSSWTNWWYAQSFSQRAMIPSYPVMAIALGYLLQWLSEKKRSVQVIIYTLIGCCVSLNIFQTIQLHKGVIDGDRMTRNYYFATFGKLHATAADKKLLLINRAFDGSEKFADESEYTGKIVKTEDFENVAGKSSVIVHSGSYSFYTSPERFYSPTIEIPHTGITSKDHAWIRVTAWLYPESLPAESPFGLVAQYTHNGYAYKYASLDAGKMNLQVNQWNKVTFDYLTPEVRRSFDLFITYFWLTGQKGFYVDDMKVEVFEKNED